MRGGGRWWAGKVAIVLVIVAAVLTGLSLIVMGLWNALVPTLFRGPAIGFWQAAGLLVLSRILFGSWRGRGWRGRWGHRHLRERWQSMTPEEREKLRERLQERLGRCGWGPGPDSTQTPGSAGQEAQAK